jgi:hypothetical protein
MAAGWPEKLGPMLVAIISKTEVGYPHDVDVDEAGFVGYCMRSG